MGFQTSFRAEGIKMPFMEKESMMHFIDEQDKMIVRVPYKGDRVALYIVLPKEEGADDLSGVELNKANMDSSKMEKTLVKLVAQVQHWNYDETKITVEEKRYCSAV